MRIALTDLFCKTAKPAADKSQTDYFDSVVPGLALRVTANRKSWSFMSTNALGKRQRKTLGHYPSLVLASARTAALTGREPGQGTITVGSCFLDFLKAKERRTHDEVKRRFDKNTLPVIGNVRLADFTRAHAIKVVDEVKERGAPVEALRCGEDLRAFARWCVGTGRLDRNPLDGIVLPDKPKARERVLTEDEIRAMWAGVDVLRPDYAAVIRLALLTGQRRGEICNMTRVELDLTAKTWTIPGERAKNGKPHLVPLSPLALEIIKAALVTAGEESARVFPLIADPEYLTNELARRKSLGLPKWGIHDLRRTALTHMQRLGVAPIVLSAIANHFRAGVTLQVYALHSYQPEKRAALDLWCERLEAILVNQNTAEIIQLRA